MHSISIFPCIMTMISIFPIFLIFQIFIVKVFFTNITDFLHFHMIPAALLLIISFFFFLELIIFIACSLKDSQNFFIQSLPLYASCLFSMLLNEDIIDLEKPDGICSLTFVVDEFSGLLFHPSIFSIIHARSP